MWLLMSYVCLVLNQTCYCNCFFKKFKIAQIDALGHPKACNVYLSRRIYTTVAFFFYSGLIARCHIHWVLLEPYQNIFWAAHCVSYQKPPRRVLPRTSRTALRRAVRVAWRCGAGTPRAGPFFNPNARFISDNATIFAFGTLLLPNENTHCIPIALAKLGPGRIEAYSGGTILMIKIRMWCKKHFKHLPCTSKLGNCNFIHQIRKLIR